LMTSAVGIAFTLPGSPFVAGNVISAADVNAKFAAIEAKLSELDIGFMATMSGPGSANCGVSTMGTYSALPFDTTSRNDGSFITGSYHYSVPANAYYRILTQVPFPSYGGMTGFRITRNGTSIGGTFSSSMNELVLQLNTGDLIKVEIACDDKGKAAATMTVPTANAIFGVKAL
ncbi:MAG: hypothetical protein KC493_00680, partial [Bacteriovoracaceae bacterium]|nr:hypothetical protein [Bacteriovoracaceae bacterium]